MDRLTGIQVFVAIAEEGSITAGARKLNMSAVMAGRYLTSLEKHVEARLIERTTRGLNLTDAGLNYLIRSKRILDELSEADHEAADVHHNPRGTLRIAAPVTFGTQYLGPLIAQYMANYPTVNVTLQLQDHFIDLVTEGVDIALRIGHLPEADYVARKITDFRLMACASPDYLANSAILHCPDDLFHHRLIGYLGALTTLPWSFHSADGKEFSIHCVQHFQANNTGIMLEVALANGGIVYGPEFVFRKALAEKKLLPVLTEYRCPEIPMHAITPNAKYVSSKTRRFIDYLMNTFRNCPESAVSDSQHRTG